MTTQSPITNAAELRSELIQVLGSELGTYQRPGLADTLAIHVLDRPVPAGYKVKLADSEVPPINGLEVLIQFAPEYQRKNRNYGSALIGEGWRVFLVFHEQRQNPQQAIRSIIANFATAGEFSDLQADKLIPTQYSVVIRNRLQIMETRS
jgi:hypothetical protein